MTQKRNKTPKLAVKTATRWRERAREDRANRKQISRAQKFALELLDYLDENRISQKELAQKMNVSPQQVNKILRAKSNLTFETLDKIEAALGVTLTSPKIKSTTLIRSQLIKSKMKLVHKSSNKSIEATITKTLDSAKNAILETNLDNVETFRYTADKI